MPYERTTPTTAPVVAYRRDVESWFSRRGVPTFSEQYKFNDVAFVGCALLIIAGAFELTVLPWLGYGVGGSLAVLGLFTILLLPLIPDLRRLLGPRTERDGQVRMGATLLRAGWFMAVGLFFAMERRDVRAPGWIDFWVLLTFLLAAALVSRCKLLGAWDTAPRGRRRILAIAPLLIPLFALNGGTYPPWSSRLFDGPAGLVSQDLVPAPASLLALPFAALLLLAALSLPSDAVDSSRASARRDFIPAALVVLGLDATVASYLLTWEPAVMVSALLVTALASVGVIAGSARVRALADRLGRHWLAVAATVLAFLVVVPAFCSMFPYWLTPGRAFVVNAIYLGVAALVVGFSLDRIGIVVFKEAVRNIRATLGALAQVLPLLLIVLVFLGITTEVWQVTVTLDRHSFLLLTGALAGLIAVFALLRGLLDVGRLGHFASAELLLEFAPVEAELSNFVERTARRRDGDGELNVPLSLRQRLNAAFVMAMYQVLYAFLVTLGMATVFYALGKLSISETLLDTWANGLSSHTGFADAKLIDQPWARVSLLLGLFSGFHFVVQFTHDADLRAQVMAGPDRELRRKLAVRLAYADHWPPEPRERRMPGFLRWPRRGRRTLAFMLLAAALFRPAGRTSRTDTRAR
jgi:hypothetical protein